MQSRHMLRMSADNTTESMRAEGDASSPALLQGCGPGVARAFACLGSVAGQIRLRRTSHSQSVISMNLRRHHDYRIPPPSSLPYHMIHP